MKNKVESIIDGYEHDVCFLCGGKATETHHIFEGNGRRTICDKQKLVIRLCHFCHDFIHHNKDGAETMKALHELGQRTYEEKIGTREQFRQDYIRSYL